MIGHSAVASDSAAWPEVCPGGSQTQRNPAGWEGHKPQPWQPPIGGQKGKSCQLGTKWVLATLFDKLLVSPPNICIEYYSHLRLTRKLCSPDISLVEKKGQIQGSSKRILEQRQGGRLTMPCWFIAHYECQTIDNRWEVLWNNRQHLAKTKNKLLLDNPTDIGSCLAKKKKKIPH